MSSQSLVLTAPLSVGRHPAYVDVIVDRATPLGNPFKVGEAGTPDAQTACARYRTWLNKLIHADERNEHEAQAFEMFESLVAMAQALSTAKGPRLRLLCWCKRGPCHTHVLAKAIMWAVDQRAQSQATEAA